MDDVARSVGLNKGTLYHYYPSKAAILADIYGETVDAIAERVRTVDAAEDPEQELAGAVASMLEVVTTRPAFAAVYFQESPFLAEWLGPDELAAIQLREQVLARHLEDIVARGVRAGVFRDVSPRVATFGIIGMIGWTCRWYRSDGPHDADAIAQQYAEMVLHGLRA